MKFRTLLFAVPILACNARGGKEGAVAMDSMSAATMNGPVVRAEATAATVSQRAGFAGQVAMSAPVSAGAQQAGDPLQGIDVAASAPAMVIRTGQAFIEVEKVDPAVLRIRQLSAQVGGYIGNSAVSGGRDQIRQATLELKIPAQKYDEAVGSLSSIGNVETVNSTAQDVGEEYVDIAARVSNSKKLEDRLLNLLATRTGKLQDVLMVERELANVREEIERYEGRLRYLSSRAAISTLTITIHEPAPLIGGEPGSNPIAVALRRAWQNFVTLVAGIIAALGILLPLAAIALLAWLAFKKYWKSRNN